MASKQRCLKRLSWSKRGGLFEVLDSKRGRYFRFLS